MKWIFFSYLITYYAIDDYYYYYYCSPTCDNYYYQFPRIVPALANVTRLYNTRCISKVIIIISVYIYNCCICCVRCGGGKSYMGSSFCWTTQRANFIRLAHPRPQYPINFNALFSPITNYNAIYYNHCCCLHV